MPVDLEMNVLAFPIIFYSRTIYLLGWLRALKCDIPEDVVGYVSERPSVAPEHVRVSNNCQNPISLTIDDRLGEICLRLEVDQVPATQQVQWRSFDTQ